MILLIDDDPKSLSVLISCLKERGCKTLVSDKGANALALAEDVLPDLVLLNRHGSGWDGFDICRQLKKNSATQQIPVIFTGICHGTAEKEEGFFAGGIDYLDAPYENSEALARVEHHLTVLALQKKEEELERVNRLAFQALELNRSGYWSYSSDDPEYFHLQDKVVEILGLPKNRENKYHVLDDWQEGMAAADPQIAEQTFQTLKKYFDGDVSLDRFEALYPFKRPDNGEIVWIQSLGDVTERRSNGDVAKMSGVLKDITAQKEQERKTVEATRRLELLFEGMTNGFSEHEIILDPIGQPVDFRYLYVNPALMRISGFEEEVVGKTARSLYPDIPMDLIEKFGQVARTGVPMSLEQFSPFLRRYFKVNVFSNSKGHFAVVYDDITDIKKQEDQLRISEARLRHAIESSKLALFDLDVETMHLTGNPLWYDLSGLSPDMDAGRLFEEWFSRVFPADSKMLQSQFETVLEGKGDETLDVEHRYNHPTRGIVWFHTTGKIIDREPGSSRGQMIGFIRDITERRRQEEEYKTLSEKLKRAQTISGVGHFEWFPKTGQVNGSDEYYRFINRNPEEDVNLDDFVQLIHPEDRAIIIGAIESAISMGRTSFATYRMILDGSKTKHIGAQVDCQRDSDGKPLSVLVTIQDVSEQKNVERELVLSQKRLESLIRVSQDEITTVQGFLGRTLEEALTLTGSRIGYIFSYDEQKQVFILNSCIGDDKADSVCLDKDGIPIEEAPVLADIVSRRAPTIVNDFPKRADDLNAVVPGRHEKISRFLGLPISSEDGVVYLMLVVNKEDDYNEMDSRQLDLMMDVIRKRIDIFGHRKKLIAAKEEAEQATMAKSQFLATMSHEVRTPLHGILGFAQLLRKTNLSPKQHNFAKKIVSSSNSLQRIIDDILDFSKIEAGKVDFETIDFDLLEVFEKVATFMETRISNNNVDLIMDVFENVPTVLVGDPVRVEQVLLNMVSNAVKFTKDGSVVVSARTKGQVDDRVVLEFSVKDTGIGMSEEQMSRLFEPFAQADNSTTRKFGGSGLGLAITKRLVEMMNGHISVQSEPGVGSEFTCTVEVGVSRAQGQTQKLQDNIHGLRVLVVDDLEVSRGILREMLESLSFYVYEAETSQQAISILESAPDDRPINIVLIEWKLSGIDGLETSHRIKTHPSLSSIPHVIMITSFDRDKAIQAAREFPIDAVISKPINPSHLISAIMSAVVRNEDEVDIVRKPNANDIARTDRVLGSHLLLVEDNEISQEVGKAMLLSEGFVVDIANNGREAVEMVAKTSYDAVLMDVQMPVVDGLEATRIIRDDDRYSQLPIIAMTANVMAGDAKKYREAGMNDVAAKPIDMKKLLETLSKWIQPLQQTGPKRWSRPRFSIKTKNVAAQKALSALDLKSGLERIGGNEAAYRKLLSKFKNTYADFGDELANALGQNDMERAGRLVHSMKGVSGNIGAQFLYEISSDLNNALNQGATEDLNGLLAAFCKEIAKVIGSIALLEKTSERHSIVTGDTIELDVEAIEPIVERMAVLLEEGDMEAVDCLQELERHLRETELEGVFRNLERNIEKYEFEDGLVVLNQIANELAKYTVDDK